MQNRFTQWTTPLTRLTKQAFGVFFACILASLVWAEEPEEELPIEYTVTQVKGYLYGTVDGETAYKDWRRGTFDKEQMVEIKPYKIKQELPEPVVVPFTPPKVSEVPVGKPKKPPLKGEDKIFVQIGEDEKKARCFILGEGCEELVKPDDEQDSVYFKAIEKAKERKALEQAKGKGRTIIQQ